MTDFSFEKLNDDSASELRAVSIVHESAPLNWDPHYLVTEDRILFWIDYLKTLSRDPNAWIMLAKTLGGEIVGLHWIKTEEKQNQKVAKIESLWTSEFYRGKGLGSQLKRLGEEWARSQGAIAIFTEVFYTNKKMIDFNLKCGFKPLQCRISAICARRFPGLVPLVRA